MGFGKLLWIAALALLSARVALAAEDTKGCPSKDVLQKRFDWQNDHNGGGYGYYFIKRDDKGNVQVVNPTATQLDFALNNAKGDDDALRFLWGTHCAYPDDAGVSSRLAERRKSYLARTGMSEAAETSLHQAMIDVAAAKEETAKLCKQDRGDGALGIVAAVVCDHRAGELLRLAWDAEDRGKQDIVYPAAAVAACAVLNEQRKWSYPTYRLCLEDRAAAGADQLTAALGKAGAGPLARARFLADFEIGVATLDLLAKDVTKHDKGYPDDAKYYDDVREQVEKKYLPVFRTWEATLREIEAWVPTLKDGPGYAEGCEEKYTKLLQRYVDTALPKGKAKDDALLDVLQDPVGYRLSEALAECHLALGDEEEGKAIRDFILGGGVRVTGPHDAVFQALDRGAKGSKYENITTWVTEPNRQDLVPAGPLSGVPTHRMNKGTAGNVIVPEVKIGSVSVKGDQATLTFPKNVGDYHYMQCEPDYAHVVRVDEYGYVHYGQKNCKEKVTKYDATPPPITIDASAGKRLAKGVALLYVGGREGSKDAAIPLWARKGDDVFWAIGVSAP